MKKLAVIQIISGILIVASFFLYLFLIQDGYNEMEILDINGRIIGYMQVSPMMSVSHAIIKTVWTTGYPAVGLLIAVTGIVRLRQLILGKSGKAFDIAQIVFGILAIALMILFILRLEPSWQSYPTIEKIDFPGAESLRFNPGWLILTTIWRIVCLSLGAIVTASGIWQIEKSRAIKR